MAATVVNTGLSFDLTAIDANYSFQGYYPLESIQFVPGAGTDKLIVRDGTATGAVIFMATAPATLTGDMFIKYFNGTNHHPYIVFAECALSAGHRVLIEKR